MLVSEWGNKGKDDYASKNPSFGLFQQYFTIIKVFCQEDLKKNYTYIVK